MKQAGKKKKIKISQRSTEVQHMNRIQKEYQKFFNQLHNHRFVAVRGRMF
jgi:hypothetical protein